MAQHKFSALDGLRGLAALFVITRHTQPYWTFELYRSYLAVDLFFLMSGFVIAYSYERKLQTGAMSTRKFIGVRLIRLYPMYLMSLALALALDGSWDTSLVLHGVLMVPSFDSPSLFPLDGAYWSLFWELVVNIIYVLTRPILTTFRLAFVAAAAGLAAISMARLTGGLDLGFMGNAFHVAAGFARALFGISLGILIYRRRERLYAFLPSFIGPSVALGTCGLILCSPFIGRFNYVADGLVLFLVFPVCLLAATKTAPIRFASTMTTLGAASYAVYLFHPLVGQAGMLVYPRWITAHAPASGVILVVIVFFVALVIDRIDIAIRRTLSKMVFPLSAPRSTG